MAKCGRDDSAASPKSDPDRRIGKSPQEGTADQSPPRGNRGRLPRGHPRIARHLSWLTLVNPASQTANDAFVWVSPSPVPGSDPARINGSFFLDPQSLTLSTSPGLNRLRLVTLSQRVGDPVTRLSFALVRSADRWSLEASYWPDLNGPVVAGSAFLACAAAPCGNPADWHNNRIELQWHGGNPAHLTVWRTRYLNGVPDTTGRVRIFNLDLTMPGVRIDEVRIGKSGAQSAGTFGQVFFDEISFTR